jgi:hypothetical protein
MSRAVAPPTTLPLSSGGRGWIAAAFRRIMERGSALAC